MNVHWINIPSDVFIILQKYRENKKERWELDLGKYILFISRNKSGRHSTTANETALADKK